MKVDCATTSSGQTEPGLGGVSSEKNWWLAIPGRLSLLVAGTLLGACPAFAPDLECVEGAKQPCGFDLGVCTMGKETCRDGVWQDCTAVIPTEEVCDGQDNNCDGHVDEVCECTGTETQTCGRDLGACALGEQTCLRGEWSDCEGGMGPSREICDGKDNNCDGHVDEICECDGGDTQACGSAIGECEPGRQMCVHGLWGGCIGKTDPVLELCDGLDNDCDGNIDDGFNLGQECPLPAGCRGVTTCDDEEEGIECVPDERYFEPEMCDGKDNDCDGAADYYTSSSGLHAACGCSSPPFQLGDPAIFPDSHPNLCDPRKCSVTDADTLKLEFCMNCPGRDSGSGPFLTCESTKVVDFSPFDVSSGSTGLIEVRFEVDASGPTRAPINLWYQNYGHEPRKYLPLLPVGAYPEGDQQGDGDDEPAKYVKYFRPEDACFPGWDDNDCHGDRRGEQCPDCAPDHTCGRGVGEDCDKLDFSQSVPQLVVEWCGSPGKFEGVAEMTSIRYLQPGCLCETDAHCSELPGSTCEVPDGLLPPVACPGDVLCQRVCTQPE